MYTDTWRTHTFRRMHSKAGRLCWGHVDGVTQSDSQADRATQESAQPRFPRNTSSPEGWTTWNQTDYVAILAKKHIRSASVSSFTNSVFSTKQGDSRERKLTMLRCFTAANHLIPQGARYFFLSLSRTLFPCVLICLAGNSPVAELRFSSVAASSVDLSLRGVV